MSYRAPGFAYPGGKVRLREWLVRRMPMSGGKYVEPFAGRGNVFWLAVHMLDYKEWWLNDPWTARWFKAIQAVDLRSIPDEMTKALIKQYRNRAVDHREEDDVAVALENTTMFSGGARDGISHCYLRCPSLRVFKRKLALARSILKQIHPRITDLEWRDCNLERLSEDDFVYLDPPYMNSNKRLYHYSTVLHSSLLRYLQEAPHLWMISGYPNEMYRRFLGSPASARLRRLFVHQNQTGAVYRHECIWTNYTIGTDGEVRRKRLKLRRISKKMVEK